MVVEAYTNGVSTRKIKHLAESLGIESITPGEVSQMNKSLDEMVKEFHEQKLEKEMPARKSIFKKGLFKISNLC